MAEPSALLVAVFARDNGRCRLCDRELKLKSKDCKVNLILPLEQGGPDEFYNMQLCCASCEKQRGQMSNLEYEKHLYSRNRKGWEALRRAQGRPAASGPNSPSGWPRS
jgi:5-methylcytosine-specific restriction endonuclease McrA